MKLKHYTCVGGCYLEGVMVYGAFIGHVEGVGEPLGCQQVCEANSGCVFWTYSHSSKECWLLEETEFTLSMDEDRATGLKHC